MAADAVVYGLVEWHWQSASNEDTDEGSIFPFTQTGRRLDGFHV